MNTDSNTDLRKPLDASKEAKAQHDVDQADLPEADAKEWDRTRHARFATSA